ncbi:MAG: hypothetical protein U0075_08855 [Thermomicrobiales bacterium]
MAIAFSRIAGSSSARLLDFRHPCGPLTLLMSHFEHTRFFSTSAT